MFIGTVVKQPRERRDRDIPLDDFFSNRPGDAAVSAEATVDDESLTIQAVTQPNRIKIWFADGVDGRNYKVTVLITTEMGRVIEAEIRVRVREL